MIFYNYLHKYSNTDLTIYIQAADDTYWI